MNFARHIFLKTALLIILTFQLSTVFAETNSNGNAYNFHTTYSSETGDSVTISWRTNTKIQPYVMVNQKKTEGFSKPSAEGFQNHTRLENLQPNESYKFQCYSGNEEVNNGEFSIPDKNSAFSFACVGDIQIKGHNKNWQDASKWLKNKDINFWLPVGDLVQQGLDQNQWNDFFSDSQELCLAAPIMPVVGNHDTYQKDEKGGFWPTNYVAQFDLPKNSGVEGHDGLWYSFDYGLAHFVILNTHVHGSPKFADENEARKAQVEWLEKDLAKNKKQWIFASFHVPAYSSGPHGPDSIGFLKKEFLPIFDKYKVTAVFNGHTHAFENTVPIRNGKQVASYKEGTLYHNGAGIAYSAKAKGDKWFTEKVAPAERLPYTTIVTVKNDIVSVDTYNYRTDELIDSIKINN
jgi:hypothetical protein